MKNLILSLMVLIFNGLVIAGTAYLVFWKGQSGWWFLLTVFLLHSVESKGRE